MTLQRFFYGYKIKKTVELIPNKGRLYGFKNHLG